MFLSNDRIGANTRRNGTEGRSLRRHHQVHLIRPTAAVESMSASTIEGAEVHTRAAPPATRSQRDASLGLRRFCEKASKDVCGSWLACETQFNNTFSLGSIESLRMHVPISCVKHMKAFGSISLLSSQGLGTCCREWRPSFAGIFAAKL